MNLQRVRESPVPWLIVVVRSYVLPRVIHQETTRRATKLDSPTTLALAPSGDALTVHGRCNRVNAATPVPSRNARARAEHTRSACLLWDFPAQPGAPRRLSPEPSANRGSREGHFGGNLLRCSSPWICVSSWVIGWGLHRLRFMPHPTIKSVPVARRRELSLQDYVDGVLAGDRVTLGRAITLVESTLPAHEALAQQLLLQLLPHTGSALRVGITGVPGAGKSTFIEAMGSRLTKRGRKVAVLAIDPSSSVTGGSILGDKTRMAELSADSNAFIRPSPSAGTLGGVTRKTRETLLVCEAGGFDVVIIETVGTGQSETVVDEMVDCFLVLMVAGTGDELQGIKRGVLELADIVAVNKADSDNIDRAALAKRQLETGLHYMRPKAPSWLPRVVACSARERTGLDELWRLVEEHRQALTAAGDFATRRQQQQVRWMWSMIKERLLTAMREHPAVEARVQSLETAVAKGQVTASQAAEQLLSAFGIKAR